MAFLAADYTDSLSVVMVDLVISQYAGLVGQATKKYLKKGGLLLCNDSHGDATIAKLDADFEFIGIITSSAGHTCVDLANLDQYFSLPKGRQVDLHTVRTKMKEPNYCVKAPNYVFKKI